MTKQNEPDPNLLQQVSPYQPRLQSRIAEASPPAEPTRTTPETSPPTEATRTTPEASRPAQAVEPAALVPDTGYDDAYFEAQLSKSLSKVAWQYGRLLRWAGVPREPGLRVLDAGCGAAPALRYLTLLGYRTIGTDLMRFPLQQAAIVAPDALVACNDLTEGMALADESVDVVLAADVIEHIVDGEALLRECLRVLRPGGYAIVSTVNAWDLRRWTHPRLGRVWSALTDPTHVRFYSPPALGNALRGAGFQHVRTWAGLKPLAWLPLRRPRIGIPYPPLLGNGLAATGRKIT